MMRENRSASSETKVAWKDPPRWLPSTFHALSYRGFLLLWLGQVSNTLGMWMDLVARPLLVIIFTASPVHLGLVTLARGAPMLLLGPVAGVLADRLDRRMVILTAKSLMLAVNAAFAALIVFDLLELWHLYATAILKSVLMAFDRPARQALLPSMVPRSLLTNAVALNMGSMQSMRIVSASLTGLLVALWATVFALSADDVRTFSGVYLLIVGAYIVAVFSTYFLPVPERARPASADGTWFASFLEGVRFAWHHPVILGVLALIFVQSLFGSPYLHVFVPWLAIQVMGIGPGGAGMLIAVSAAGSLAGAIVVATYGSMLKRRGRVVLAGSALFGLALAVLGLSSTLPPVLVLGLVVPALPLAAVVFVGIAQATNNTIKNTLLLENSPDELRGRVVSLNNMDRGANMVGGSMAGFAIALVGGPLAAAIFGACFILGALSLAALFPALRRAN